MVEPCGIVALRAGDDREGGPITSTGRAMRISTILKDVAKKPVCSALARSDTTSTVTRKYTLLRAIATANGIVSRSSGAYVRTWNEGRRGIDPRSCAVSTSAARHAGAITASNGTMPAPASTRATISTVVMPLRTSSATATQPSRIVLCSGTETSVCRSWIVSPMPAIAVPKTIVSLYPAMTAKTVAPRTPIRLSSTRLPSRPLMASSRAEPCSEANSRTAIVLTPPSVSPAAIVAIVSAVTY